MTAGPRSVKSLAALSTDKASHAVLELGSHVGFASTVFVWTLKQTHPRLAERGIPLGCNRSAFKLNSPMVFGFRTPLERPQRLAGVGDGNTAGLGHRFGSFADIRSSCITPLPGL
jgi:hypothetical protein